MLKVISSHVFLRNRLHPGLLETIQKSGADGVELFAARQHFDYNDRSAIRDLSEWFRSNPTEAFSMHAPLYADYEMGRWGAPGINVIHPEKARRIDAMDEIKRALEVAEQIPFRFLIVHLGEREDTWSPRALEYSITALEHLRAFASPLGVKLLIENIPNDVTRPANIIQIINTGHFTDIGVCLDVGHANLGDGVKATLDELKDRIRSSHLHDNQGDRDAHLWPGDGSIVWDEVYDGLKTAPQIPAGVLEINYSLEESPETVMQKAAKAFESF
ncbi:MAG: sugar phosphate isomerase/epimerase [Silvibacterium sp.]|nr:sugar phosphate isomerase/epimerase [Silvibacterium sp.]MBV8437508.1 sugar phosphate isomerase/epimerase [Silvibacterium sp.]